MIPIPTRYKQASYVMELQKREANVAVYKAIATDYWEVHIVRIDPGRHKFGKFYPEHEKLAGSEEFGQYAWACVSQERADARMRNAIARMSMAEPQEDGGDAG